MNIEKLPFLAFTLLLAASTLAAQSLGEIARQQREQRSKEAKKATKVYTNENMPARPPEEGATAATGISAGAAAPSGKPESGQPATEPRPVTTATKTPETATAPTPEKPEDKVKTKDYWQGRFKAARAQLAGAQEEQQLVQDELQLLQIQQAREINTDVQKEVVGKIAAKKAELDAKSAATAKAQKDLADLDGEFKDSGAPEEWSKTD
jgi:hypothetical protein